MRIHCLLKDPKKKGVTAIYFTVRYSGEIVILYPRESIDTALWINKNGINKPKPCADNTALIGRLSRFELLIRDTYDELLKQKGGIISGDVLKKAVYEKKFPTEVSDEIKETYKPIWIDDFFQKLIDESVIGNRKGANGKVITQQTIKTYKSAKKHFQGYQNKKNKQFALKDINQKLIDGFSDYLNNELKLSMNSGGKYMKTLKILINYARSKKLINADVFVESKIRVAKESSDNIYLTEQEIGEMMKINQFETKLYEVVRDLFVVGCKTGLRFSDYSTIRNANINQGFIILNQQKTSQRVTIPIHPLVQTILNKYPGGLPKCPPNQVFNKYLKEIGKKLPQLDIDFEKVVTRAGKSETTTYKKWEILQTHTARRSFCTNEYLNGTPTLTIMAISGHKTEKSFISYIKADSLQHAMMLKKKWKERGDSDTTPSLV